jgi:hypothetical protein
LWQSRSEWRSAEHIVGQGAPELDATVELELAATVELLLGPVLLELAPLALALVLVAALLVPVLALVELVLVDVVLVLAPPMPAPPTPPVPAPPVPDPLLEPELLAIAVEPVVAPPAFVLVVEEAPPPAPCVVELPLLPLTLPPQAAAARIATNARAAGTDPRCAMLSPPGCDAGSERALLRGVKPRRRICRRDGGSVNVGPGPASARTIAW